MNDGAEFVLLFETVFKGWLLSMELIRSAL